jgi:uncharacterized protein
MVFAVPVGESWLVHAPLHGMTALVNRAALEELERGASELPSDSPRREPQPREGPVSPQFLGIVPTRACNLACVYCGFGATPCAERMDRGLAAAAVDWMGECAAGFGRSTLDVHLFGGEPFAAPEVVDAVVERTREAAARKGLRPQLEVATNGVYSEARARRLGESFDTVVLSLDGFSEFHDRHRPFAGGQGSFEQVERTARVLSGSPARVSLRICVAQDNVGQLPETVAWFCEEFHPFSIDCETLQPTPESERAGLDPPDPYVFARQFRAACHCALERGVEAVFAAALAVEPRLSFCPVGNDTVILHPDGRVSACYLPEKDWEARGMDLHLGRFGAAGMELDAEAVARVRRIVADKPRCRGCFCRWSCAGGCHVNHSFAGCATGYDDFCLQTRILTACTLLDGLGLSALADRLVIDRAWAEALARQAEDRPTSEGCGR